MILLKNEASRVRLKIVFKTKMEVEESIFLPPLCSSAPRELQGRNCVVFNKNTPTCDSTQIRGHFFYFLIAYFFFLYLFFQVLKKENKEKLKIFRKPTLEIKREKLNKIYVEN